MVWKIVTYINVIWCVCAVTARPSQPSYATSEQKFIKYLNINEEKINSRPGSRGAGDHEEYVNSYPSYEFSYKVKDPYTHDIKGQQEKRHGDKVNGDYWLVEPDGRKRIVKYHANDKIGFKVLIDYLKKEGLHLIPNNDEKKSEEVEEEKVEISPSVQPEPESEKNQSAEKNVQREEKTNQSNEGENVKSEPEEVKEEQSQNDEKESEQKAHGEGNLVYSSVKIKKVIKPRLTIRINENNSDVADKRKEKQRESGIARERNPMSFYVRKDWSMKKEKLKVSKQENEKIESEDKKKEAEQEHSQQPQNKGYEVREEVIENDSGSNNAEQEIKKPKVEIKTAEEKVTKSVIEANENKKDENNSNKESKAEVYAYKTFICHPRYE